MFLAIFTTSSGRYNKHNIPPKEKTVEDELKELIVRVCDRTRLIENVIGLSEVLVGELENYKVLIIDTIFECAKALSYKTSIYSSLVSILLSSKTDIADSFYERYNSELLEALKERDFYSIKLLVRFAVELYNANVFSRQTVIDLLLRLVRHIIPGAKRDYNDTSLPKQHVGDFYVGIIIPSIVLSKDLDIYTDELESLIKQYMGLRLPMPSAIFDDEYLRENIDDEDEDLFKKMEPYYSNKDWLERLYQTFEDYLKSGKSLEPTLAPWKNEEVNRKSLIEPINPTFNIFGDLDNEAIANYILFNSTEESSQLCMFTFPHAPIKLLPYDLTLRGKNQKDEEYDLSPMEKWFLDDYVQDVLHFFKVSPKDTLAQLQMLPFNFEYIEAYLCEVIIAEMLRIPSPHKFVYYGFVIMELCRAYSESFPSFLGGCIDTIFRRANTMDTNSLNTFINWFSFHLSNFAFKWDWKKWKDTISDDENSAQLYLIKETIRKCLRLSYYERIQKTLPNDCSSLLPPKYENKTIFSTKTNDEGDNSLFNHPSAVEIFRMMESSTPVDEVSGKVRESLDRNDFDQNGAIHIITRAILTLGSKSMTSLSYVTTQFLKLLQDFGFDGSHVEILKSIHEHYKDSPQQIIISSLQMVRSKILKPVDIIRFILHKEHLELYGSQMFSWELLNRTVLSTLEEFKSNGDSSATEKDELYLSVFEAFEALFKQATTEDKPNLWFKLSLGYYELFIRTHFSEIKGLVDSIKKIFDDNAQTEVHKIHKDYIFLSFHY